MKLHSPIFERSLRRQFKHKIKSSPKLKKEFRSANRYRRGSVGYLLAALAIPVALALFTANVLARTHHIVSALAVLSLWTFMGVFSQANGLRSCLFGSNDLPVLGSLPVSEQTIFRWQLQKFLRASLLSLVNLLVAFGTLAVMLEFSVLKFLGVVGVAVLTWAYVVALAAHCIAHLSRLKYQFGLIAGIFLGCGSFVAYKVFGTESVMACLDRYAPSLNLFLPTGWAVTQFRLLAEPPYWLIGLLLVPILAVLYTVPSSLKRLRSFYVFHEIIRLEPKDLIPATEPEPESPVDLPPTIFENRERLGPSAIAEIIQRRQFLALPSWPQRGWLEKCLWQWFTPRERTLSEFLFPSGLVITKRWVKLFRAFAMVVAAGFIVGLASPTIRIICIAGVMFVTFAMALSLTNEAGMAFQPALNGGVRIPLYINFAIGFRELSRLLIKITVVQMPALLVWSLVAAVLVAYLTELSLKDGLIYGLRGAILLSSLRFMGIVLRFSSGTNDTHGFTVHSLALLSCVVLFGLIFLGLVGVGFFIPNLWWGFGLSLLAALDAYIFMRIYGWFYQKNFFDLMSLPKR